MRDRLILCKTDQLLNPIPPQFHIQGYLSGFEINDSPFIKTCPGCGTTFAKQYFSRSAKFMPRGPQTRFTKFGEKGKDQLQYLQRQTNQQYECYQCNQFFDYFAPKYIFHARFADFSGELNIGFFGQYGDAILGCPAKKFQELKARADSFGGHNEVSQQILIELYERLLYRDIALEVKVKYQSKVNDNKVSYVCNGVNWGKRVDWPKINNCLINRLSAYQERYDAEDLIE